MTLSFDLRAGETYPAVWIPADATDTTTYYPQAVFRNALSFAVIATVNLTKQTDGSYTGNFTVPQDPSGLGMILLETVTIYTDAGHTSATNLYGILQNKHKVVNANANFGGGGGDNTDYDYLEKMIKKIVEEAIGGINFEQKDVDLSPIDGKLSALQQADPYGEHFKAIHSSLEELKNKKVDFPQGEYDYRMSSLTNGLAGLGERMDYNHSQIEPIVKKHLEGQHINLEPIVKKNLEAIIEKQHISDHQALEVSHKNILEKLSKSIDEIKKELADYFDNVDYIAYRRENKPNKNVDYNLMARNLT